MDSQRTGVTICHIVKISIQQLRLATYPTSANTAKNIVFQAQVTVDLQSKNPEEDIGDDQKEVLKTVFGGYAASQSEVAGRLSQVPAHSSCA